MIGWIINEMNFISFIFKMEFINYGEIFLRTNSYINY